MKYKPDDAVARALTIGLKNTCTLAEACVHGSTDYEHYCDEVARIELAIAGEAAGDE